ncbi:MAG: type II toxin-antitoxin system RelE/ParE family toxin [Terracidiphilus sp.]
MPKFSVSKPTQSDMRAIVRFTVERWGVEQALRYARDLQACFHLLADNSGMGRACDAISPGLRRHEQGKHVVFYRLKAEGIRIVRVLHQQMIPDKSRFG